MISSIFSWGMLMSDVWIAYFSSLALISPVPSLSICTNYSLSPSIFDWSVILTKIFIAAFCSLLCPLNDYSLLRTLALILASPTSVCLVNHGCFKACEAESLLFESTVNNFLMRSNTSFEHSLNSTWSKWNLPVLILWNTSFLFLP